MDLDNNNIIVYEKPILRHFHQRYMFMSAKFLMNINKIGKSDAVIRLPRDKDE